MNFLKNLLEKHVIKFLYTYYLIKVLKYFGFVSCVITVNLFQRMFYLNVRYDLKAVF